MFLLPDKREEKMFSNFILIHKNQYYSFQHDRIIREKKKCSQILF